MDSLPLFPTDKRASTLKLLSHLMLAVKQQVRRHSTSHTMAPDKPIPPLPQIATVYDSGNTVGRAMNEFVTRRRRHTHYGSPTGEGSGSPHGSTSSDPQPTSHARSRAARARVQAARQRRMRSHTSRSSSTTAAAAAAGAAAARGGAATATKSSTADAGRMLFAHTMNALG